MGRSARSPVSQQTVHRIQDMILQGTFAPGARLPAERRLAAELSVSRASLREALSILEALGLVRSEAQRGTFVTVDVATNGVMPEPFVPVPMWRFASRYTLAEVFQFRLLAEAYAARLATMAITDADVADLRQIAQDHKEATRRPDFITASQADFELHHRILQLSGNRILADLHETYRAVLLESQRVPLARHERRWEPVDEHEKLLHAIERRDPDGAEYYMRLHLIRAADRVGIAVSDTPRTMSGANEPAGLVASAP